MLSKGKRSQQISVNNLTRKPSIFTLFKLSKTLGNMSLHTLILYLLHSLFRIILIPDDIFRFYKNFHLPILLGNFGFFYVVFFSYIFNRYTSVQD